MSNISDAVTALRHAVAAVAAGDEADVSAALQRPEFASAEQASIPGQDKLDHVRVDLTEPASLGELERSFGPARMLPRRPDGGGRTVLFEETMPGDGESGATLLAELDEADCVKRLILRADSFA